MENWRSRLAAWLTRAEPKPSPARVIPDEPAVDRETYLEACNLIVGNESGRTFLAHYRHLMWSEAGANCPVQEATIEQVALWQCRHEGRMEVLESIVLELSHNLNLAERKPDPRQRPLGREVDIERLFEGVADA